MSSEMLWKDVRLPTVLWGKFASDVTNAIQLRSEERVILVLGLGRLRFGKSSVLLCRTHTMSLTSSSIP
ncbi:unnamed protein product [Brassica oleracea]|uniref:Uncharacterized protein n=2 Tax=Brassica TaxID=3705 RepID=A0A3P6FAC1_BRAOL|nr:unnamed protein product [Brassica napus]VDD44464.1 unnamed protein product [Brassica oleracea]